MARGTHSSRMKLTFANTQSQRNSNDQKKEHPSNPSTKPPIETTFKPPQLRTRNSCSNIPLLNLAFLFPRLPSGSSSLNTQRLNHTVSSFFFIPRGSARTRWHFLPSRNIFLQLLELLLKAGAEYVNYAYVNMGFLTKEQGGAYCSM